MIEHPCHAAKSGRLLKLKNEIMKNIIIILTLFLALAFFILVFITKKDNYAMIYFIISQIWLAAYLVILSSKNN